MDEERATQVASTGASAADERRQALLTLSARARSGSGSEDDAWSRLLERAVGPEAALTHTFGRGLRHLSAFERDVLRADLHPGPPSAASVAAGLSETYGWSVTAEAVREFRSSARQRLHDIADTLRLVGRRDRCGALAGLLADWGKDLSAPIPDEVVAQVSTHHAECRSCGEWVRATPLTAEEARVLGEWIADHFDLPSDIALPRWLAGPRPRRRFFARLFARRSRRQSVDSATPE